MTQELTTDTVDRYIEATPEALYDLIADVTRTPERTPDVVRCEWLDGATGPKVGARFKATNRLGRGPNWSNKPVVTVADRGEEFSFTRTEPFAGTILWRHRFVPEGSGTRMYESYEVIKPIRRMGWFIIDTLYGMKDRRSELRASMVQSMDRVAELLEVAPSDEPAIGEGTTPST
jgi:Polyketide cyclase / dehydrase and lipid transport